MHETSAPECRQPLKYSHGVDARVHVLPSRRQEKIQQVTDAKIKTVKNKDFFRDDALSIVKQDIERRFLRVALFSCCMHNNCSNGVLSCMLQRHITAKSDDVSFSVCIKCP